MSKNSKAEKEEEAEFVDTALATPEMFTVEDVPEDARQEIEADEAAEAAEAAGVEAEARAQAEAEAVKQVAENAGVVAAAEEAAAAAEAEAAEAKEIRESLDRAKVEPSTEYKPIEPPEDKWTTVSGKLLTSEREAFKAACKADDMVPSKTIRAFVQSFINPDEPEEEAAPAPDIPCIICGAEIADDYYRFKDTYKCGACVIKLIEKKTDEAVAAFEARMQEHIAFKAAQPPPGTSGGRDIPEEPAQPSPDVAELQRVQCDKCLAEAFVPEGQAAWSCVICHFVNTVAV